MSDVEPQEETHRYIAIPKYKGCFEEVGHYTKQLSTGKIATLEYTTAWRWGECIIEITEKERRDIIQSDAVCLSKYECEFYESTDGCGVDYELDNKDNYTKKEMREIVESMTPGEESDEEEEEEEEEVEPTICTDDCACACDESPDAFECDDCGAKGLNCFENLGMSKDETTAYMDLGQPDRCEKCFDIWKNTDDAKEYLQTIDDDASTVSLCGCDTDFMEDYGEWCLDETYYYIYTGCVLVPEGEDIEDYAQGDGSYANKEDPQPEQDVNSVFMTTSGGVIRSV